MNQDLGLTTDPDSSVPLYRQIAAQVAERIRQGTLPPGYRLPATRRLAAELQTHRNTIVAAFDHLAAAGLVVSGVGRGTFVADPTEEGEPLEPRTAPFPWSSVISRATDGSALALAERLRRQAASVSGQDLVNLQRMQPADELLPVEDLRRCMAHVLRTEAAGSLGYAPRDGLPRLRAAIADDLARRSVPVAEAELLVTTGSQQALDLIARVLIEPGDTVLVQNATYAGAIHVLAAAGARLVGVPEDEEGPEMGALDRLGRAGAKGFYLMPNGQNPTGRTISGPRREAIVAWSRRWAVPLIEDDYCADLDLDGLPTPPALRALDSQVLHIGTFSKRLIPALRIGYVAFPAGLRRHLPPLKQAMDLGCSLLLQHALAEFLERGYLRTHLRRVLPEYRKRRDALERGLRRHLPEGVEMTRAQRGVVCWLSLPDPVDPQDVFGAALERGVLVSPDTLFTVHGTERGLRLTFCAEDPRRIAVGAKRLGQALQDRLRPRPKAGAALTMM